MGSTLLFILCPSLQSALACARKHAGNTETSWPSHLIALGIPGNEQKLLDASGLLDACIDAWHRVSGRRARTMARKSSSGGGLNEQFCACKYGAFLVER